MDYGYGSSRGSSSFFDGFTLSPLPYPVLLILAVIFIFLGFQWSSDYEEAVETVEYSTNWALLVVPVALLIIVRWLSTMEESPSFFGYYPFDRRRQPAVYRQSDGGGSSPWGVAALIVLLLVLVHFQSSFLDAWF